MHPVSLPDDLQQRVAARRGRRHAFDTLAPGATALLVIDMQNSFVMAGGAMEVPCARGIVPNINRLAVAARAAGAQVVWVVSTFAPAGRSAWPMFFEHLVAPERREALFRSLTPGDPGHALWAGLGVQAADLTVAKDRFSAFIEGASPLEAVLRARGIDTVLVTGTVTNVCCESTARDAMMRDFRTIMVSDANAARSDAEHLAALATFLQSFGDVMTTDEVIARLTPPSAGRDVERPTGGSRLPQL